MQEKKEMQVWPVGWEDILEEGMTTHFSIQATLAHTHFPPSYREALLSFMPLHMLINYILPWDIHLFISLLSVSFPRMYIAQK